jgi:hypothetical protein
MAIRVGEKRKKRGGFERETAHIQVGRRAPRAPAHEWKDADEVDLCTSGSCRSNVSRRSRSETPYPNSSRVPDRAYLPAFVLAALGGARLTWV